MLPSQNPHLIQAYVEYMQARDLVQRGMLGNAVTARNRLRVMYRIIAGKSV